MPVQIVIRTPNHLGDFIMALPMITEAREAYPGSEVTVLIPEHLSSLLTNHIAIDRIVPIPPGHLHGALAIFKIKAMMEKQGYDVGYVLPPSFGSAAAFKLAGVKERVGYIADGRRLLLTKPLPLPEPLNSVHRSELYFNLLRRGSNAELTYSRPKLFLSDEDINAAKELLVSFDVGDNAPYFVIGFRSKADSRRWGQESYTALCKRLLEEFNFHLLLVGSKEDSAIGDAIAQSTGSPKVVNLAGKNTLREVGALMSMARLFVGDDSGPAHLAASVGSRIVVLFGAGDPQATAPLAWNAQILYRNELPCISCLKNVCPLSGPNFMACMKEISVDMVVEAVRNLLTTAQR